MKPVIQPLYTPTGACGLEAIPTQIPPLFLYSRDLQKASSNLSSVLAVLNSAIHSVFGSVLLFLSDMITVFMGFLFIILFGMGIKEVWQFILLLSSSLRSGVGSYHFWVLGEARYWSLLHKKRSKI